MRILLALLCSVFLSVPAYAAASLDKDYKDAVKDAQNSIFETYTEAETALNVREKTLKESAYAFGFQKGAAYRNAEILSVLEKNKLELDKTYDFSFLMIEGQVVPPVIVGGEQYTTENQKATRIMQTYIIKSQPRFASFPPSWREYLYQEFEEPKLLDKTLLPKNDEEEELIKSEVARGFSDGVNQADYLYSLNMNRLNRDIKGMILFHKLAKRGLVAMPKVKRGDLGITIKGNELKIGETVFTVEDASFNNPKQWKVNNE